MVSALHIESLRQALARVLTSAKGLPEHASIAAFVANLGHAPSAGDRFYDTTAKRVRIFHNNAWRIVGGA